MRRASSILSLALVTATAGADPKPKPQPKPQLVWGAAVTLAPSSTAPAMKPSPTSPPQSLDIANLVDPKPYTPWCEGNPKAAVGESITITLHRPLAVAAISINTDDGIGDRQARVREVEMLLLDDKRVIKVTDGAPVTLENTQLRSFKVTITKVSGPADGVACISDLLLYRTYGDSGRDTYDLFTGPAAAADQLAPNLVELRAAFAKCDAKQLARVVKFPLAKRAWVGADDGGHGGREQVTTAPTAARLAALCAAGGWSVGGTLDQNLANLALAGPDHVFVVYQQPWKLEWDGTRWWLVAVHNQ